MRIIETPLDPFLSIQGHVPGPERYKTEEEVMSDLLKDYPVVIEFPVAWGEMDSMGHVNNIVYFRYFESARIAYFEKTKLIGHMIETGIGPILGEISCRFRIPLSYPDKVLIGAKVVSLEDDRFTMNHVVVSTKHQKVAAEGDGAIVAFNYREGKKVSIPDVVKRSILDIEKNERALTLQPEK